ncbi:hypothetical protein DENSPDRAFT_832311 [Dentipellis sp. KUC8613]|nr:hypothetical protein DENSPDRAFT_832311 [Dentipellis sp. KUC8613]
MSASAAYSIGISDLPNDDEPVNLTLSQLRDLRPLHHVRRRQTASKQCDELNSDDHGERRSTSPECDTGSSSARSVKDLDAPSGKHNTASVSHQPSPQPAHAGNSDKIPTKPRLTLESLTNMKPAPRPRSGPCAVSATTSTEGNLDIANAQ